MYQRKISIIGMHCNACTIVVADELEKIPGVTSAKASLKNNSAIIEYSIDPSDEQLERAIKAAGYSIGSETKTFFTQDRSVIEQFIISILILALIFLIFRRTSLTSLNFQSLTDNSGLMALAIGLTAGFSTCMAMIGGLVLGMSARFSEKHPSATAIQKFRPHLFFNSGRIVAFFVLGGFLGVFGSVLKINSSVTGLLTIVVGFVMIILGLQLTELFPKLTNKGITLPSGVAKALGLKKRGTREYSHKNAMALGAVSFFLPCGFTQAMQLLAISSGSFLTGALVMGLFAIGTTPGLLGIGALTSSVRGWFANSFFRFVGVVVVVLAIYNISNGMTLAGYRISFERPQATSTSKIIQNKQPDSNSTSQTEEPIILTTSFNISQDIKPNTFNVEVGKPYILEVNATEAGVGCMSTIMIPGIYKTPLLITKGKIQLPFTITKPGSYEITCAMGIPRGVLNASEGGN